MIFTIDEELCTFCGICAAECPPKTIAVDRERRSARIHRGRCIECGHCAMVCPEGAVTADGELFPEYPEHPPYPAEHIIRSKRSVRSYRPEPLSPEDIDAVFRAGETSPTASNSRQVDAVLITGADVQALAAYCASLLLKPLRFVRNPAVRWLFARAGLARYMREGVLERFTRGLEATVAGSSDNLFFRAPAVVVLTYPAKGRRFGRTDCALAGQNMMLTAHERGIGSCMIGFAEASLWSRQARLKAGVAPDRRIGLIFTLGYSARRYYRYPLRVHWSRGQ